MKILFNFIPAPPDKCHNQNKFLLAPFILNDLIYESITALSKSSLKNTFPLWWSVSLSKPRAKDLRSPLSLWKQVLIQWQWHEYLWWNFSRIQELQRVPSLSFILFQLSVLLLCYNTDLHNIDIHVFIYMYSTLKHIHSLPDIRNCRKMAKQLNKFSHIHRINHKIVTTNKHVINRIPFQRTLYDESSDMENAKITEYGKQLLMNQCTAVAQDSSTSNKLLQITQHLV